MIKNGTVFVGIRTLVIRTFNCSKKWISILNKVDFENIKTQVATLERLTEKQYDKKVCPHCFDSSYSVQKKFGRNPKSDRDWIRTDIKRKTKKMEKK